MYLLHRHWRLGVVTKLQFHLMTHGSVWSAVRSNSGSARASLSSHEVDVDRRWPGRSLQSHRSPTFDFFALACNLSCFTANNCPPRAESHISTHPCGHARSCNPRATHVHVRSTADDLYEGDHERILRALFPVNQFARTNAAAWIQRPTDNVTMLRKNHMNGLLVVRTVLVY